MPAMPTQLGPPTAYALASRPCLLLVLVLQSVVCVMRMVLLADIMGGFLMAVMVGLGVYAWREDMNITVVCYWGVLCLINGAFDFVKVVDYLVKMRGVPLFSDKLPLQYNFAHVTLVAIPLVTLLGCPLAWFLHKDHSAGLAIAEPAGGFHDYGAPLRTDRPGLRDHRDNLAGGAFHERSSLGTRGHDPMEESTTFRAFGGQGMRLSGTLA